MTTPEQRSGTRRERVALAAVVTLVFLFAAGAAVDLGQVAATLSETRPLHWALCLSIMLGVSFLRFLRVAIAAPSAPRLAAFRASALHGAAIAVLPGRAGEAALPLALKSAGGPGLAESAGLLLLIRLYDLVALLALLFVSLAFVMPGSVVSWGAAAAALAGFLLAPAAFKRALGVVRSRLPDRFAPLVEAAAALRAAGHVHLLIATAGVWGGVVLASAAAMRATLGEAGWSEAALSAGAASFAFASPVNGLASLGPFEGAYAGVLAGLGHDPASALGAGLMLHACALAAALAAAAAGGASAVWPRRRKAAAE